jgi:GTP cyclohydrolase I
MDSDLSSNGHLLPTGVAAPRPMLTDDQRVDLVAAERAARELLIALGADLGAAGLLETPRRMAAAYAELLTPEPFSLTSFPNDEGYDELVVVRDIRFSRCTCITSFPSKASPMSLTWLPSGSSGSQSSREWWSILLGIAASGALDHAGR